MRRVPPCCVAIARESGARARQRRGFRVVRARSCRVRCRPASSAWCCLKQRRSSTLVVALCRRNGAVLLPIIETAVGMAHATAVAATPCVQRLMFGTIDFQLELGIDGDGDELLAFRSAARAGVAARRHPVAGRRTVHFVGRHRTGREPMRGVRASSDSAASSAFIPKQVARVNAAFSPSEAEVTWARKVLDAAERSGGAAVAVDGKMIDRPVILKAERIVRELE